MFLRLVDLPAIALLMMPLHARVVEAQGRRAHAALRHHHRPGEPARQAVRSRAAGPGRPMPTLAMDGGKSPAVDAKRDEGARGRYCPTRRFARSKARTHLVKAPALAPVLTEFFAG